MLSDEGIVLAPASPKQQMILENDAQILIIGGAAGSGKSFLLNLLALFYVDDPNTFIGVFRRVTDMLRDGIFKGAKQMYAELPKEFKPRIRDKAMELIFPSGANMKFKGMQYVQDKLSIQGHEYTLILVDEATQFEWEQLDYMMSRLRSPSKYESRMVMSCNPDPDHKIRELIDWYLDEEGYPIPERDGVKRWFIRINDEFIWGFSKEELLEKYKDYPDKLEPLSFSFISATINDNPIMDIINPTYRAMLLGLPELEKAQLYYGNWNVRIKGANYFQRTFLKDAETVPSDASFVRSYDKAGTERASGNKNPDFTAGIKIAKDSDGFYYILGDYCDRFVDDGEYSTGTKGRFCKKVGERDAIIEEQARLDGDDCIIIFSKDPGQAGISEFNTSSQKLIEAGFIVEPDPVAGNKSKLTKFSPFASAAQQGMVYIVKKSFDANTLEAYLKELEKFDGLRSTVTKKDDWCDATSSGFNYLATKEILKAFTLPKINAPTLSSAHNMYRR